MVSLLFGAGELRTAVLAGVDMGRGGDEVSTRLTTDSSAKERKDSLFCAMDELVVSDERSMKMDFASGDVVNGSMVWNDVKSTSLFTLCVSTQYTRRSKEGLTETDTRKVRQP